MSIATAQSGSVLAMGDGSKSLFLSLNSCCGQKCVAIFIPSVAGPLVVYMYTVYCIQAPPPISILLNHSSCFSQSNLVHPIVGSKDTHAVVEAKNCAQAILMDRFVRLLADQRLQTEFVD